jgi:predicted RNA-binding protein with PUA-like domain
MPSRAGRTSFWLFKEDPSHFSFDKLLAEGRTGWEGVSNNLALKYLRAVKKGDLAFFYRTGEKPAVVGIMRIVSDPYHDPNRKGKPWVVVDVEYLQRLPRPVGLAELKASRKFAKIELVRLPRLSVMPVPERLWREILQIAGLKV